MGMKLLANDYFVANNQTIAVEPRLPQKNYPEHNHNFDELVIVTQGRGRHILNGYPHDLYQGMILYVEARDCHLYEDVQDLHLTNILFKSLDSFRFLNDLGGLLKDLKPNKSQYQMINKKILLKVNELLDDSGFSSCENCVWQECQFFRLLALLQKNSFVDRGLGSTEERGEQVLSWLTHNFAAEIDWDGVARQFALPLRTLHRYIKARTGCTPQHYLTKLRLADAYYQLRYTDKNVITVAQDCGFNDSGYFATCFKKEFMFSPRAVRT